MKFQVFKNGVIAEDFNLSAAYLFGSDTIALRTSNKITFKNGFIDCKKKTLESAGLALLWPVEGFGKILLTTTRLPERKRPYILNVELARAKLMQIVLKREEWSLFEETDEFARLAHEAQSLFIESLRNISDPGGASVLADEALKKAIIFSEQLACKHAEQILAIRCKNRTLSRHSLGCRIDSQLIENEKYRKRFLEMFGFVTIPFNWGQIETKRGEYDFSAVDRCMDLLANRRLAMCAGPLLCFSPKYIPEWMMDGKLKYEKIREIAFEFVSRTVSRYSSHIHAWRVISGMNAMNHFEFDFGQIIEITRAACLAARSANASSRKIVEILFPWGEYYAYDKYSIPPLVYADMIVQNGINFDAFALQMLFGKDSPGMHVRDMMQISSRLDNFASVAKPVHISGVAIPDSCCHSEYDCDSAGYWRRHWDQPLQAEWIEEVYKIALGKPFINSVTYSDLADSDNNEMPGSGLLKKNLSTKKAFLTMAKLQKFILRK